MLRIAHRGASAHYPENTMLAFRKAVEAGANAFEFDVHLCASGEPVVIHDEKLSRTTNGKGRVDAHTLSELQQLDAGSGEHIPALSEMLEEFGGKITLFIEIKAAAAALPVARMIGEFSKKIPYEMMPAIGFNSDWLKEMKVYDSNILIGASPDDRKPIPPGYLEWAKDKGFFSVNPNFKQLTTEFVNEAHTLGLQIHTWTVNKPADIERMKALNVDGIMSDYPELL